MGAVALQGPLTAALLICLTGYVAGMDVLVAPKNCHDGFRLQDADSYITHKVSTSEECVAACYKDGPKCDSVSWRAPVAPEKEGDCALNWGRTDVFWTGIEKTAGWKYYEKKHDTIKWESCRPRHIRNCEVARRSGQPMDEWYYIHLPPFFDSYEHSEYVWWKVHEPINPDYTGRELLYVRCELAVGRGWAVLQKQDGYSEAFAASFQEYEWGIHDNSSYFSGLYHWHMMTNQYQHWKIHNYWLEAHQDLGSDGSEKKYGFTLTSDINKGNSFDQNHPDGKARLSHLTSCLTESEEGFLTLWSCHDPNKIYFRFNMAEKRYKSIGPVFGEQQCWMTDVYAIGVIVKVKECSYFGIQTSNSPDGYTKKGYRFRWEAYRTSDMYMFYEDYTQYTIRRSDQQFKMLAYQSRTTGNAAYPMSSYNKERAFTTFDKDLDGVGNYNLGMRHRAGFWFYPTTATHGTALVTGAPLSDCMMRVQNHCMQRSRMMFTPEGKRHQFLPV